MDLREIVFSQKRITEQETGAWHNTQSLLIGKGKMSLCLSNYDALNTYCLFIMKHHSLEDVLGSVGITAAHVLNLGTNWKWVARFTLRPLFIRGNIPCFPFSRRLGGPQDQARYCSESKAGLPVRSIVTVLNELPWAKTSLTFIWKLFVCWIFNEM
jgi:hypothetical protein